jgi:hypothetical protein
MKNRRNAGPCPDGLQYLTQNSRQQENTLGLGQKLIVRFNKIHYEDRETRSLFCGNRNGTEAEKRCKN